MDKIMIKSKPCSSYKIAELKEMLKAKGFKISGTKSELCERIKESRKHKTKPASIVIKKNIKLKVVDVRDSLFKFYASTYYQCPGSMMAQNELSKYGLKKNFLNKFPNHKQLFNYLKNIPSSK